MIAGLLPLRPADGLDVCRVGIAPHSTNGNLSIEIAMASVEQALQIRDLINEAAIEIRVASIDDTK